MQKAEKRLATIVRKVKTAGLSKEQISELDVVNNLSLKSSEFYVKIRTIHIGVLFSLFLFYLLLTQINYDNNSECLIDMPPDASRLFREVEDCKICESVTQVDKVSNISSTDFDRLYISKSCPVVVTDGARNWSAMEYFSFDFFKKLYASVPYDDGRYNCQFFPYKTEFSSLEEALNMKEERARLEPGEKPWYIGWSNCNDAAGNVLKQYYHKPYFLPNTSENLAVNWIFMGGPGPGAHMHVDNVVYPSWQAQISGRKTWKLAPPPECFYKCQNMEVTVEPGEIIVVDTNKWYHQTNILPGDISITIGSEFD